MCANLEKSAFHDLQKMADFCEADGLGYVHSVTADILADFRFESLVWLNGGASGDGLALPP